MKNATQASNKSASNKSASNKSAQVNTNAPSGIPGIMPNNLGALVTAVTSNAATPANVKAVPAATRLALAIAANAAAPGATALAHTFKQAGVASIGNVAKLPAGSLTVTSKGAAYKPKAGYNANAWASVQAALNAGPCQAAQAAQAIGHAGVAWVAYAVKNGWLAVTA
jgi:hypothetical protein